MDNNEIELVGSPCGYHGPYTFYKAFKYSKNGIARILSLSEFFFVKLWSDSDLVCVGELQLLWVDKNSDQILVSLRLYFLPENTPEGRVDHGEDEVLAISEKVVLRAEDLLTWITLDTEWTWGRSCVWSGNSIVPPSPVMKTEECDPLEDCKDPLAINCDLKDPLEDCKDPLSSETSTSSKTFVCTRRTAPALTDSVLDFSDVEKERSLLDDSWTKGVGVMVLSYPRYCRYRALMKRLENVEDKWLKNSLVSMLGGFTSTCRNTRVLFCKDTFDYPDLEGHELLCNHLAPKLKGRPRGKRKKRSISPGGSESNESESSLSTTSTCAKTRLTTVGGRNGLRCNTTTSPRRSTRSTQSTEEREFLSKLNIFMKTHRTPIGRLPSLGYKEIDLYKFYSKVQRYGGYEKVTSNRMWKSIFDELGGNHGCTSAATIIRKHYEKFLLSFERNIKNQERKSQSDRRRLKSKNTSFSDAENNESSSGHSTPVSCHTHNVSASCSSSSVDNKIFTVPHKTKSEGKTSSLRSVRVKPDRIRESLNPSKIGSSTTISSVPEPQNHKNCVVTPITPSVTLTDITLPVPVTPVSDSEFTPEATTPDKTPTLQDTPYEKAEIEKIDVSPEKEKQNCESPISIPKIHKKDTSPDSQCNKIDIRPRTDSPEIIDLEAEDDPVVETNILPMMIPEVKKRKLDILKEGGLEVTAVSSASNSTPVQNDSRPSVIHQFSVPEEPIKKASSTLLPSKERAPSLSRFQHKVLHTPNIFSQSCKTSENRSPFKSTSRNASFTDGQIPPKVIQSRSIYSRSHTTVYGNPKDPFMPPPLTTQLPRHIIHNVTKSPSSEVLDLTIKTSQKPVVEIMRVPNVPLPMSHASFKEKPVKSFSKNHVSGLQMIDGRVVGSNLEITLVENPKSSQKVPFTAQKIPVPSHHKHTQKRSASGKFMSNKSHDVRIENGKSLNRSLTIPTYPLNIDRNGSTSASADLVIPTVPHLSNRNSIPKIDDLARLKQETIHSNTNSFHPAGSPVYSNFMPHLPNVSSKNPYFQMFDPIYYTAALAQGLYSNSMPMTATSVFPQATSEQLQLYKQLMANNSRLRFQFPNLLPETSASITSVGQTPSNKSKN